MEGSLRINVEVTPIGEVSAATVTSNTGLSASVANCCTGVVRRATFSEPKAATSFGLPLTFRPPR
jgi:hypothetical protein